MSETRRWRDTDHLDRAIETAGAPKTFGDEQLKVAWRGDDSGSKG